MIAITDIDELPFAKSGKAEPGPAFVTRSEIGTTWGRDKRLLEKIDNADAISGLVVIDTWLRNTDRYFLPLNRVNLGNVFFSRESSEDGKLSLRAMDFSNAIQYGAKLGAKLGDRAYCRGLSHSVLAVITIALSFKLASQNGIDCDGSLGSCRGV